MPTASDVSTRFGDLTEGTWVVDPVHSDVSFTVRHLMSKVRGQFTRFDGELEVAQSPLDSRVTANIDLSSVDTRNPDRDRHLRSSDFFGVESGSAMRFQSTHVADTAKGLVLSGDLTIKDVTKGVELDLEFLGVQRDGQGHLRAGFEASTEISRKEWGITFNVPLEGDRVMIGDQVAITISVEAVRQS